MFRNSAGEDRQAGVLRDETQWLEGHRGRCLLPLPNNELVPLPRGLQIGGSPLVEGGSPGEEIIEGADDDTPL